MSKQPEWFPVDCVELICEELPCHTETTTVLMGETVGTGCPESQAQTDRSSTNYTDHRPDAKERPLTRRMLGILRALHKLRAIDRESRCKAKALLPYIEGCTSADSLRVSMPELLRRGYVESAGRGRDGGYWLSALGIQRVTAKK